MNLLVVASSNHGSKIKCNYQLTHWFSNMFDLQDVVEQLGEKNWNIKRCGDSFAVFTDHKELIVEPSVENSEVSDAREE